MRELPLAARVYILALTSCSAIAMIVLLSQTAVPTGQRLLLAISLVILIAIIGSFQIRFDRDITISLDFSVLFAAALLLHPGVAMLVACLGIIPNSLIRRIPPHKILFNAAAVTVMTGAVSVLLWAGGIGGTLSGISNTNALLLMFAAGLVMFEVNMLTLTTVISLSTGRNWFELWRNITLTNALSYAMDIALGLLAVLLAEFQPWAILLVAVPICGLYILLDTQSRLRRGIEQAMILAQQNTRQIELMTHKAHHDPLTGLPNRALLSDALDSVLSTKRRHDGGVAVMFVDLDTFKKVNDTYGHEAGDQVLREVGARLSSCVRPTDTVARVGGDEFTLVLDNVDRDQTEAIAERVVATIKQPYTVFAQQVTLEISVGIALSPNRSDEANSLLRQADRAMYAAKQAGSGRFRIHEAEDSRQGNIPGSNEVRDISPS